MENHLPPNGVLILSTSLPISGLEEFVIENLQALPPELREKTLRYRTIERRAAHIAGKLILREGLRRLGYTDDLEPLRILPGGKPILPIGPKFSISHAGSLVACAFSRDWDLGLDIETCRDLSAADFFPWFTADERTVIEAAGDTAREVIRLWTRKEALYKALGDSSFGFAELSVPEGGACHAGGREWHLSSIGVPADFEGTLAVEAGPPSELSQFELEF